MTDTPDAGPCRACPWRLSNQGKRHPDGWYTRANLRRLWHQLKNGEPMSCHPTDPSNPVSEKAQAAGYRPAPEHSQVRECAGALILQQREFMLLQNRYDADVRWYRRERTAGLTRDGILAIVARAVLGGTPFGGPALPKPNLAEPDVGLPWLPWSVDEALPREKPRA